MDIRIEIEELPEGGFRAYVYKIVLAQTAAIVRGKELYGNTKPQVKAKIVKRIAYMLDAILPEAEK